MNYFFRFEYGWLLYILFPVLIIGIIARYVWYRYPRFSYSLAESISKQVRSKSVYFRYVFFALRVLIFFVLALLLAKPQLVDYKSEVPIEGIDIMLVLDVSGSMRFCDENETRSRFEIAKDEAIRFSKKREYDALGLVLFGKNAISRCPLTFDKNMLKDMIEELELGDIDADGTMLVRGILAAANRLKYSTAKSKIMILLTDGEPSEGDVDSSVAIEVANKLGIKIYTVGIGSEGQTMFYHPFYGHIPMQGVNKELLDMIANQTGGKSFMAHNAADMRAIYDTIDQLEKTEHEVPLFSRHEDVYQSYLLGALYVLCIELFLSTFVFFTVLG